MSGDLPVGYTWRRPTGEDAEAIFALVSARNTDVIGFADFTLDDTRDMLSEPGFDPITDGWLVTDPDGALVGFGCVFGDCETVDIDVTALDDTAAEWLLSNAVNRAAAIAAKLGNVDAQVNISIYRADEAQRARATALGFAPATTYHRMRIDHDGAPPEPLALEGVVVRAGPGDKAFRREAHAVLNASFADHFGFVPKSFDEWHERTEASATHDWSQLRVAYVDGEPAAMLLGSDAFIVDEDWVRQQHRRVAQRPRSWPRPIAAPPGVRRGRQAWTARHAVERRYQQSDSSTRSLLERGHARRARHRRMAADLQRQTQPLASGRRPKRRAWVGAERDIAA